MADRYTLHLERQVAPVEQSGRWTPGRKASLLELIRRGDLSMAQACAKYDLSAEEVASWQRKAAERGQRGLGLKYLQEGRRHG